MNNPKIKQFLRFSNLNSKVHYIEMLGKSNIAALDIYLFKLQNKSETIFIS